MTFSIEQFKAATFKGLAKPSKYRATINFYKIPIFTAQTLAILCESAQLPGRSFRTEDEYLYGVARKMPLNVVYDDFSLGFICTSGMPERKVFDKWHSFICNPTSNYMHFYDDYKANITVETFNDDGTLSHSLLIEEAYPLSVNVQTLSYSETDSYLKLDVDFAYKKWRNSEEIALGDQLNQGYQFQPHIFPVSDNNFLTGEWMAPENLATQQDGNWRAELRNPFSESFELPPVINSPSNDLSDSFDLGSGENIFNQTSNPVPDFTLNPNLKL